MNRLAPLLIFLMFAAMATVLLLDKERASAKSELVDKAMPALTLHSFDGEKEFVTGDGIVVLNFFASWCAPCIEETGELLALKQKFPNVTFHGIFWNDTKANIDTMLKEHGNPYNHIWADDTGSAAIALGLRGIPETFVVKNGRIVYHLSGIIKPETRTNEIEPLLAH